MFSYQKMALRLIAIFTFFFAINTYAAFDEPLKLSWSFVDCSQRMLYENYGKDSYPQIKATLGEAQDAIFKLLTKNRNLKQAVSVTNDITSTAGKLYFLVDEKKQWWGFAYSLSEYPNDYERAKPRIFSIPALKQGAVLGYVDGKPAATLKLLSISPGKALMEIEYVVDANKGTLAKKQLEVSASSNGQFAFLDPQTHAPIQNIHVITWLNLFSMNGGVKKLEYN